MITAQSNSCRRELLILLLGLMRVVSSDKTIHYSDLGYGLKTPPTLAETRATIKDGYLNFHTWAPLAKLVAIVALIFPCHSITHQPHNLTNYNTEFPFTTVSYAANDPDRQYNS